MISQITTVMRDMSTAAQEMNTTAHLVMDSPRQQSQLAATLASAVQGFGVHHARFRQRRDAELVTELLSCTTRHERVTSVVKELTADRGKYREAGVVHQLGERTANITQVIQIIKDIAD